ncbi:MAG: hypothetical protein KJO55_10370 [Gammaproteobacteria bacterium]|nr:hypothetical protein [Gammaproteobacteria bacterium]
MRSNFEQVVIVKRRTELEELVARFNTVPQAKFYLEQEGHDFSPISQAHERFYAEFETLRRAVPDGLKLQVIERELVSQFTFGESDIVIAIGQDGLVANTAKYVGRQPIIAVNPDPGLFDGHLLPFIADEVAGTIADVQSGHFKFKTVTLAQAELSDGQSLLAFNDFFIGARSHTSARYRIAVGNVEERQSSSGIIVSTGAGSSGWLQSVYAGAAAVTEAIGGKAARPPNHGLLPWDTDSLVFAVREPFPSQITAANLVFGSVSRQQPLQVTSEMNGVGRIFSDGIESDYLEFNTGARLVITPADSPAILVQKQVN